MLDVDCDGQVSLHDIRYAVLNIYRVRLHDVNQVLVLIYHPSANGLTLDIHRLRLQAMLLVIMLQEFIAMYGGSEGIEHAGCGLHGPDSRPYSDDRSHILYALQERKHLAFQLRDTKNVVSKLENVFGVIIHLIMVILSQISTTGMWLHCTQGLFGLQERKHLAFQLRDTKNVVSKLENVFGVIIHLIMVILSQISTTGMWLHCTQGLFGLQERKHLAFQLRDTKNVVSKLENVFGVIIHLVMVILCEPFMFQPTLSTAWCMLAWPKMLLRSLHSARVLAMAAKRRVLLCAKLHSCCQHTLTGCMCVQIW